MNSQNYVRRAALPALTGLSYSFFKRAAVVGGGPPFRKVGRACLYRLADVEAWLEKHKATGVTTSQPLKEVPNDER